MAREWHLQVESLESRDVPSSGSISGNVWEDANGNGTQDTGESGISGLTVELLTTSNSVLQTTTTDTNGNYTFSNLSDGQYLVAVDTSESFTQPGLGTPTAAGSVFDLATGTAAVTITNGDTSTGINAGLYTGVTVTGTLFVDANNNGQFQVPDAVIAGTTITLQNVSGTTIATSNSLSDGSFVFANLAPGTYSITVSQPLGYQFTTEGATGNPAVDSSVNPTTGQSATVTLADGAAPAVLNAGLLAIPGAGSISGTMLQTTSAGESGAMGVAVQLIDPATGTILQQTVTDANGNYTFGNLVAGTYSVSVQTYENFASGSAFSQSNGTASVSVSTGQAVTGLNASLVTPQQATFELPDGTTGTISYTIPWNQVDPTQPSQSIALTDFTITIGGQTFSEGSANFTTPPSIQFAYGQQTGLTFALATSTTGSPPLSLTSFNSSASFDTATTGTTFATTGLAYTTISASGFTLSAFNANTNNFVNAPVKGVPQVILDCNGVFNTNTGKIGVTPGTLTVTITPTNGNPIIVTVQIQGTITGNALATALVNQVQNQLQNTGLTVTNDGGMVTITGSATNPLVSVSTCLTGVFNSPLGGTSAGGAVYTIVGVAPPPRPKDN
jgi:hypothetical protein